MMRIAIAGGGCLAGQLALHLTQSSNPVLILSRSPRPDFEAQYDCQVAVVDYNDEGGLEFAVRGIDLVICTFRGPEQIKLIHAARRANVQHFVPAEFEGCLDNRPEAARDPLDMGSSEARQLLRRYARSRNMQFTVFSCGVFFERFGPGGLGSYNMGSRSYDSNQGDFLINVGEATADLVEMTTRGRPVQICMTAVDDVARFVAAAVDLGTESWPREYRMCGELMTVSELLSTCINVRGGFNIQRRRQSRLQQELRDCETASDWAQWYYIQRLRACADGRYHFADANLNALVGVQPLDFRTWLEVQWSS